MTLSKGAVKWKFLIFQSRYQSNQKTAVSWKRSSISAKDGLLKWGKWRFRQFSSCNVIQFDIDLRKLDDYLWAIFIANGVMWHKVTVPFSRADRYCLRYSPRKTTSHVLYTVCYETINSNILAHLRLKLNRKAWTSWNMTKEPLLKSRALTSSGARSMAVDFH